MTSGGAVVLDLDVYAAPGDEGVIDGSPDEYITRGYKVPLDPTPAQVRLLLSYCGAARFAFNHTLNRIFDNIEVRQRERDAGVAEADLTPALSWYPSSLGKEFNALKDDEAPWWREVPKHCFDTGIRNAAEGFANWKASKEGRRAGPPMRVPHYKSRHRAKNAVTFVETNHQLSWLGQDRHQVRLMLPQALRQSPNPKIRARVASLEWIHTHGSTRRLYNMVASGRATIQKLTISCTGGRWWASFSVRILVRTPRRPVARIGGSVGVDLGLAHLATLSVPVPGLTDEHGHIANPHHLDRALVRIVKLDRQLARATPGSKNHARIKRARARRYAALSQTRALALHRLTTYLAGAFDVVCIEDLDVASMIQGRGRAVKLAKQINDAAWSTLVAQLAYKTAEIGTQLVEVNRFYPSSKTCSCCGAVKAKLDLSDRVFSCEECGISLDRDINAARNIEAEGLRKLGESPPGATPLAEATTQ